METVSLKNESYDFLLTEKVVAEMLSVTPRALQKWRLEGRGPKFVKISSRAIRYRRQDLNEWVERLLRKSTSDHGDDL